MEPAETKDLRELYEDGKHRRYTLMFSVNGGAFAIAKLLKVGEEKCSPLDLGSLTLPAIAVGMIIFTVVMVVDIYAFGLQMRKEIEKVFQGVGKTVLVLLGALQCVGWYLAGPVSKAGSIVAFLQPDAGSKIALIAVGIGVVEIIWLEGKTWWDAEMD
jgi:hypothetical protein